MWRQILLAGLAGLIQALAASAGEQGTKEETADIALIAERLQTSLSDSPVTLHVRIDALHDYCDFSSDALSVDAGYVLSMSGAYRCFGVNPAGRYETDSGPAGFTRIDLRKVDPGSIRSMAGGVGGTYEAMNPLYALVQLIVNDEETPPHVTGQCYERVITKEPRSDWCVSIGAGDAVSQFDRFFIPCGTDDACSLIVDDLKQLATAAAGVGAASNKAQW